MIESLLPATVAVSEAFADLPGEAPFPGEEDLIRNAVESRRREFVTARRCAREALGKLGCPPIPIRPGPGRAPQWPANVAGSITHCAGYRAAAVVRIGDLASLGIDAEPDAALPDGVADLVMSEPERSRIDALRAEAPATHWDRLLFSAKESIYKAWYPLTGRWLDFADADLVIHPAMGSFTARIRIDGTRSDGGPPLTQVTGRFAAARGLLVTAVTVPE